jgi:hypothetical protein
VSPCLGTTSCQMGGWRTLCWVTPYGRAIRWAKEHPPVGQHHLAPTWQVVLTAEAISPDAGLG